MAPPRACAQEVLTEPGLGALRRREGGQPAFRGGPGQGLSGMALPPLAPATSAGSDYKMGGASQWLEHRLHSLMDLGSGPSSTIYLGNV